MADGDVSWGKKFLKWVETAFHASPNLLSIFRYISDIGNFLEDSEVCIENLAKRGYPKSSWGETNDLETIDDVLEGLGSLKCELIDDIEHSGIIQAFTNNANGSNANTIGQLQDACERLKGRLANRRHLILFTHLVRTYRVCIEFRQLNKPSCIDEVEMIDDLRSQVDSRYGSNSDDVEPDESIADVQASFAQTASSQESKIEFEDSAMLEAEQIIRNAEEKGAADDCRCRALGATIESTRDLVLECKSNDAELDESTEDDCDEDVLDFDGNASLEYTRPTSLTDKGDRFSCKLWSELYVRLVKELYSDYESLFEPGMRFLGRRINFGRSNGMKNPKHIKDGLYLECNHGAKSIVKMIRWLLDYCSVSRYDVIIRYIPKQGIRYIPMRGNQAAYERSLTSSSQKRKTEFLDSDVLEAEKIVLDAEEKGIAYDDLCHVLGATIGTAKNLVQECKRVVEINGRLRHEDSFVDWDDGARRMSQIMEDLMQKNDGYISRTELYSYVRDRMNMYLNDNDMNDEISIFDFARHLFKKNSFADKSYAFERNLHISKLGNEVQSTFDLISKYAEAQGGVFQEDGLAEYLEKRVGMSKSNIRKTMKMKDEPKFFFCDTGTIIAADSMIIDDSWKVQVKRELTRLLDDADGHVILRQIEPIWYEALPTLPGNRRWRRC